MTPPGGRSASLRQACVRVPASTSNLGAGFDCLGIALGRYLTAEFRPAADERSGGLRVERRGTLRILDDRADDRDVLVRAFRGALGRVGVADPAGTLTVDSEIPIGRGLGSSAAAVVAGLALAAGAAGHRVETADTLRAALEFEGHLDNVAPCLLGGFVAVAHDDAGAPQALSLPLSEGVGFAFAAPGAVLETRRARAALPRTVALTDAVHNLGAVAALVRAFATADPELFRIGFSDRLHVRYRMPLIPGAEAALPAARDAGAWGATVSGAGSGLIAVGPPERAIDIADAMAAAFRRAAGPVGVVFFAAEPDTRGVTSE